MMHLDESLPVGALDDLASELEWIQCCTMSDDPWSEWERRRGATMHANGSGYAIIAAPHDERSTAQTNGHSGDSGVTS
jgi:hypothetical protein